MSASRIAAALALASALAAPLRTLALEPAVRELVASSVRPGELAAIEAAVGGLDALPFLALDVEIDLEERRVRGAARIDWPNTTGTALKSLPFRLSANGAADGGPSVRWERLRVSIAGAPEVAVEARAQSATIFTLALPKPLEPGQRVAISGALSGELAYVADGATDPVQASFSALGGSGPSRADGEQYGTFACGEGICTFTGFAPQIPAFIDGAFDTVEGSGIGDATYSEPANVLLSIVAPSDATIAATAREVGRTPAGKGLRRTSFAMAAAREVGFVASTAFRCDEATVDGVRVRSCALEADRESGRRALAAAKSALATFDKAFGRYPWAHLDVAESALVGGAGGVELPGLALGASGFYREPQGLLAMADPNGALAADILDFITRHEVAHQWWHAQVGSHAQRHPYVDEPLAQWSALVSTKRARGAEAARRARDTQVAMNFQALALLGHEDGPVARPAAGFDSPVEYAAIVYGKAPLFYEALAKEIGVETVLKALKGLVASHRFRRVTPDDLRLALARAAGGRKATVERLWKRWFLEAHGAKDVGGLDLSSVLGAGGALPPGSVPPGFGQMDPEAMREAMKLLQDFMKEFEEAQ